MNKKLATIGISVALGGVMLCSSAFAAISTDSGYDVYKAAFNNTRQAKSMTPHVQISVQDNGNTLFTVDSMSKVNMLDQTMSSETTATVGDLQKTTDVFRQNGEIITKVGDSDTYKVIKNSGNWQSHSNKHQNPNKSKDIENIVDAFVGNLQNYITLNNNSDGTKEVALQMSDSQIPPMLNAMASAMVKKAEANQGRPAASEFEKALREKLPQLVDNIKVSNVDIKASISQDNLIADQTENITITGTDANGTAHTVVITADENLSNLNSTTPDKVDLTGKQVKFETPKKMRK